MPEQRVEIRRSVLRAMTAHAEAESPLECCGLLVGTAERIEESVATTNVAVSSTRYQVAPEEHFALIRKLRRTGRTIVGAYHSHPNSPALPSLSDVAEAHYPEFVYVIVSLANSMDPHIRAFHICAGDVTAIELSPVD